MSTTFHPHSNLSRIPYEELMEYMALSTYGAYLPDVIEVDVRDYVYVMNIYHEAFLCWGFKKALQGIDPTSENSLASFNSLLNLSELRYYRKYLRKPSKNTLVPIISKKLAFLETAKPCCSKTIICI